MQTQRIGPALQFPAFVRLSQACSASVVVIGLVVLLGWVANIPVLTQLLPGLATMKANTAFLFVVLGVGLWFAPRGRSARLRRVSGITVLLVAAATFVQYLTGIELGIDQVLVLDTMSDVFPGRMAPATAVSFLVLSLGLLALDLRARWPSDVAIGTTAVIAFLSFCGYVYGASALYRIGPYVSIAFHTTVALLAACVALFFARPGNGLSALVVGETAAGTLMRRLLPAIIVIPVALGWLQLRGQQGGLYDATFGIAISIATSVGLLTIAVSVVAKSLHASELDRLAAHQAVAANEFRLRQVVEGSPYSVAMLDREMRYVYASARWIADFQLGVDPDELRGRSHYAMFPEIPERWKALHRRCLAGEVLRGDAEAFARENGVVQWLRWEIRPWSGDKGDIGGILIFSEDITEERRAALRLQESEARFRRAIDASPTGMMMVDRCGKIVLVNAQIEHLFGFTRDELLGRPVEVLVPPRFRSRHPASRVGFFNEEGSRMMGAGRDLTGLRKDGAEIPIEIGLNPIRTAEGDFVLSSVTDIGERKRADREREELTHQLKALNAELEERVSSRTSQLQSSLEEREVLLQEVHHRVKNNLQVISSLMNMQARQLRDGTGRLALEECRNRVGAIALIHEKLYQSKDYAHVSFSDYARSLVNEIFVASGVSTSRIALRVNIAPASLTVDKAIPCGLVLNELITNALKHAFPGERRGTVSVELTNTADHWIVLSVADDGVGMPADTPAGNVGSLGLQLVSTLVEQLDGRLEVVRGRGTTFRFSFPTQVATLDDGAEVLSPSSPERHAPC